MARRAKVFHVITKLELGGAQEVTLMTVERLPRDRYEVGLVTSPDGLLVERAKQIPDLERLWLPSLVRELDPIMDAQAFLSLWAFFRRVKPDIVHTHSSKAGILGRWAAYLAGVPLIFHTYHGFGFTDYQSALVQRLYIGVEKWTSRITSKVVCVSRANAEKGERHGVFKRGDWILCRDAIPVAEFLKSGPRRARVSEWGAQMDQLVVGMIACFKPQKAPVDFVDVAAKVARETDTVHFVMAGDGELRPQVEARILAHGIGNRIRLLGWQRDMPEVYRNLDIVVLTSLWEGLPCVFSEAMAAEVPIVATNVDGAREAITDGESGFLHEPHDIDGMARSVLKLATDRGLRERMARSGKARVAEFDIEASLKTLESEYRSCLAAVARATDRPLFQRTGKNGGQRPPVEP